MSLPDSVHLSPAVAASVDRLGWGEDRPLLREAAPTAARGHNLVVVAPPAPAYGAPPPQPPKKKREKSSPTSPKA